MTAQETADLIERFLNGSIEDWEWDDFLSSSQPDLASEETRQRCVRLPIEFPSSDGTGFCGDVGLQWLEARVRHLRSLSS